MTATGLLMAPDLPLTHPHHAKSLSRLTHGHVTALTHVQRDGNDLLMTTDLPLADALCGTTLRLAHLDGSSVDLPLNDVITPSSLKVVR